MAKKRLGIDALFQSSVPKAVPASHDDEEVVISELKVTELQPSSHQPRAHFDPVSLGELTESIRVHGVLQPILVRALDGPNRYEIVAGERRWRAAQAAGLESIPVRVLELSDGEMLSVAMVENLQREDLNPLEEAEGYLELLRLRLDSETGFLEFRDDENPAAGVVRLLRALNNRLAGNIKDNAVLTLEPAVAEVFARVGTLTWQSFLAHRLPLLGLPDDVRAALRSGLIPYTKARYIARVTAERLDGDEQRARIVRADLISRASGGNLSVRELQRELTTIFGEPVPEKTAPYTPVSPENASLRIRELRDRLEGLDFEGYPAERQRAILIAVENVLEHL
ncbi:MAG TPA: ParB/RepB/Spo0J family partition protein [Blastocatellia bacterium]|nr:ParB/RepB/Spo0J family partition protein [Blastocatellia bacterium]